MKRLFLEAGKPWDDRVKRKVKNWLAHFAASHAETILKEELCEPLQILLPRLKQNCPTNNYNSIPNESLLNLNES